MSTAPTIKNGKKPISDKKKQIMQEMSVFSDILYLEPGIRAELDSQNLTAKWLDSQETIKNGGYDPEGWTVYKRKSASSDTIGLDSLKFGQDPTGIIRRGSLILGVMSKDRHAIIKELEHEKANDRLKNYSKRSAQELRQVARQAQVEADIHEGYEDNE